MAVLNGCQEGKATPRLMEVKCPKCKGVIELFVRMGGSAGQTGRTSEEAVCESCGYVVPEGTSSSEFELYD